MQRGRRGVQTPGARARVLALRRQAEAKIGPVTGADAPDLQQRIEGLIGSGPALDETLRRVGQAIALGYQPVVSLDDRGNIVIEVSAVLSECSEQESWKREISDAQDS